MRPHLFLLLLTPAQQCEKGEDFVPAEPCLEYYEDFAPSGQDNKVQCPHPSHRIESETILEGHFVRRVKVTCRCAPEVLQCQ